MTKLSMQKPESLFVTDVVAKVAVVVVFVLAIAQSSPLLLLLAFVPASVSMWAQVSHAVEADSRTENRYSVAVFMGAILLLIVAIFILSRPGWN